MEYALPGDSYEFLSKIMVTNMAGRIIASGRKIEKILEVHPTIKPGNLM